MLCMSNWLTFPLSTRLLSLAERCSCECLFAWSRKYGAYLGGASHFCLGKILHIFVWLLVMRGKGEDLRKALSIAEVLRKWGFVISCASLAVKGSRIYFSYLVTIVKIFHSSWGKKYSYLRLQWAENLERYNSFSSKLIRFFNFNFAGFFRFINT